MTLLNVLKNKQPTNGTTGDADTTVVQPTSKVHTVRPRYRVEELDHSFVAEIDMPSVAKQDLEVSLADGVLDIVGSRGWSNSESWKPLGGDPEAGIAYRLRLAIGDEVDGENISANLENGVLLLTLGKVEEKKPRQIAIN